MGGMPASNWEVGAAEPTSSRFSERLSPTVKEQQLEKTPDFDLWFPRAGSHGNTCNSVPYANKIHETGSC